MKKRWFTIVLALTLAGTYTIPAGAAHSDEYWDGYNEGFDAGYADGAAAWEAGEAEPGPIGTREDGYTDGYAEGFDSGYFDAQWGYDNWEDETGDWLAQELTDAGGEPGQINVKYNDRCIDFATVWPENQCGRVMAPARPVLEALGAAVTYDGGVMTASLEDGRTLTHTVNTDTVAVTDGAGETRTCSMDSASYVTGGVTFVPVRFFAEALDLAVLWDGDYQTVVLLDPASLEETYGSQLTLVNLLLSEVQLRQNPEQTYRETADIALDLTLFDTIQGDKHLNATAKTDTLTNSDGFQTTLEVDISELMDLLMEEYGAESGGLSAEDEAVFRLLGRLEAELRYDNETQTLYIQNPLIDLMMGQTTWLEQYVGDLLDGDWPVLDGAEPLTVTDLVLLSRMQDVEMGNLYAFHCYEGVDTTLNLLLSVLGDSQFTRSGSTYTLHTEDLVTDYLNDASLFYYTETPSMGLDLQITDRGGGRCDFNGALSVDGADYVLGLDLASRDSGEQATLTFHLKNLCKGTLSVTTARRVTDELVETLPPPEAVSMALEEVGYF